MALVCDCFEQVVTKAVSQVWPWHVTYMLQIWAGLRKNMMLTFWTLKLECTPRNSFCYLVSFLQVLQIEDMTPAIVFPVTK